jgi:hypothetical protein
MVISNIFQNYFSKTIGDRSFKLTKDSYYLVIYALLGLYKILFLIFNLFP